MKQNASTPKSTDAEDDFLGDIDTAEDDAIEDGQVVGEADEDDEDDTVQDELLEEELPLTPPKFPR